MKRKILSDTAAGVLCAGESEQFAGSRGNGVAALTGSHDPAALAGYAAGGEGESAARG